MTKDEALKLALEALKDFLNPLHTDLMLDINRVDQKTRLAITAIREALAQPEQNEKFCDSNCVWTDHHPDCKLAQPKQEPVSWATIEDFYREIDRSVERVRKEMQIKSVTMRGKDYDLALPIIDAHFGHVFVGQVPTPPQRKPLTDEQWQVIADTLDCLITRKQKDAIEAVIGIKE